MKSTGKLLLLVILGVMLDACVPGGSRPPLIPAPGSGGMPPLVQGSMQVVLEDFELALEANQPGFLEQLNPGLSDAALEKAQGDLGVQIHPEMQALYQWHDGLAKGVELFPGYEYYSLEESIQTNRDLNAEFARRGFKLFMQAEAAWLILFPDAAGDGYYYDYKQQYEQGAVFFNFRESGYFIFFPSIKNLLTAITECFTQGAYQETETIDFDLENRILKQYGLEVIQ
jgi:cell wall assembly regulator SMI1